MGTRSAILAAIASLLTPDGAGNILLDQSPPANDSSLLIPSTAWVQALAHGRMLNRQLLLSSGTYIFNPLTTAYHVIMQGGGGAGGSNSSNGATAASVASGGNEGNLVEFWVLAGGPFPSVTYTIGGAGVPGAAGFNFGGAGGTSGWGAGVSVVGGNGGRPGGSGAPPNYTGNNNANPGNTITGVGLIIRNRLGRFGEPGISQTVSIAQGGNGGDGEAGSGGQGAGGGAGSQGSGYASGGGGAGAGASGEQAAGGAGTQGYIDIEEWVL